MRTTPRILIIDGYTREARDELQAGGAGVAATLYSDMLCRLWPDIACDIFYPSDPGVSLPTGVALADYDGIAWTGCSLTIYDDIPPVHSQVHFAQAAYEAGVPSFGSCWGAQIAVVAAGGRVRPNPRGREMGVARKIALSDAGRGHPMYAGKPSVFDAYISHVDEITHLPPGAVLLAGNDFTHVQSVSVTHRGGTFWGLQYHPEYDLREMARLTYCRIDKLMSLGFFRDRPAALAYVDLLEQLHAEPERMDLGWLLGVDSDLLDEDVRTIEVRNWLERLVLPTMLRRR